jgi:hypothetical protein
MNPGQKVIYLTFDDGPTPGITDSLLQILERENVQATFFCLGRQVKDHPELFQKIKKEGHQLGHHSFSHPNGWKQMIGPTWRMSNMRRLDRWKSVQTALWQTSGQSIEICELQVSRGDVVADAG